MGFQLVSEMWPSGDQPQAIKKLLENISNRVDKQVLLGVTGSGKTFTIANVIEKTKLPTLIISHNKTLAGQLYQEFKELFPKNKVSFFISYYDFYQPEAYVPQTDTYIAKEVDINDMIDKLRLETTANLFSGSDNIVIASVSCIYNIGDPSNYSAATINFNLGQKWDRNELAKALVGLYYQRSKLEFARSLFRIRGDNWQIWPSYQDWILELSFENQVLKKISQYNPKTSQEFELKSFTLFAAKQYVGVEKSRLKPIIKKILEDSEIQAERFKRENRILEASRIKQKVAYDMEMLEETGYVSGIENYSIYFEENRGSGQPPFTLVDYFSHIWGKDNFLTVIDESHVTLPQIGGMFEGDRSRKQNLIDFGFRLPSALDNRPLTYEEFMSKTGKMIFVSATPAQKEMELSHHVVVEQIIRPTGLVDPPVKILPARNQITDIVEKLKECVEKGNKALVICLTKKNSEDLAEYLEHDTKGINFKADFLHSGIDTLKRAEILENLRKGKIDVLVGVNLLREGIDLPEVSLVLILGADQQGFLRSRTSLIQIMGRASRNVDGEVVLYADDVSEAMRQAMEEIDRRRKIQQEYNLKNNIIPKTIVKAVRPKIIETIEKKTKKIVEDVDPLSLTPKQKQVHIKKLKGLMRKMAKDLNFERAIEIREKIKEFEI